MPTDLFELIPGNVTLMAVRDQHRPVLQGFLDDQFPKPALPKHRPNSGFPIPIGPGTNRISENVQHRAVAGPLPGHLPVQPRCAG